MADILFPPIITEYESAFVMHKDDENNITCNLLFTVTPSHASSFTDDTSLTWRWIDSVTNEILPNIDFETDLDNSSETVRKIQCKLTSNIALTINRFYKIQCRVVDNGVVSEWSTPVLIKYLGIDNFSITISNNYFPLNATTVVSGGGDERVIAYEICVTKDNLIIDTAKLIDIMQDSNINTGFSYSAEYTPDIRWPAGTYTVEFTAITENNYTFTASDTVTLADIRTDILQKNTFIFNNNSNNGYIEINGAFKSGFKQPVLYRRTLTQQDSRWKKLFNFPADIGTSSWHWKDVTVENGQVYQYAVSVVYNDQDYGYQATQAILCEFEDMFLIEGEKILPIRYNPSVTNWKKVIQENISNTIGSQYPFIRRSGHVNYQQFSIGGLISCRDDESSFFPSTDHIFITNQELFNNGQGTIIAHNEVNDIIYSNDRIKEKFYRDAVAAFLENGQVKLFKSPTEGNVLVYLGQVSFTPNEQLGRLLHSFSAQATEIGACSIDNYLKYGFFGDTTVAITVPTAQLEAEHGQPMVILTEETNADETVYVLNAVEVI